MTKHNIPFSGLDTQKTFAEVAYIEDHHGTKPFRFGNKKASTF